MNSPPRNTEILCLCSGKGGAGKTLFASCLGYALTRVGLRVLVIDADPATAGMSLFLLGPAGIRTIDKFTPENTFSGILEGFRTSGSVRFSPIKIYRNGPQDHGVVYDALISGRGIYGQDAVISVPDLDQDAFRSCVAEFYKQLREQGEYDYVIVDTRGGFGFESTDLCGYADSFIVVVEADPTSFYQTRNLVRRINTAAGESGSKSTLRAFLINKAVDGLTQNGNLDLSRVELSFRNELTREHPVKFESTHPIPADLEVLHSYKEQQVPFLRAPASLFTYATLSAYSEIFQIVTSRWTDEQVKEWQAMANAVSDAIQKRNEETQADLRKIVADRQEIERLRSINKEHESREHQYKLEVEHLRNEVERATAQARAEFERTTTLGELVKQVSSNLPGQAEAPFRLETERDIQVHAPVRFARPPGSVGSLGAPAPATRVNEGELESGIAMGDIALEVAPSARADFAYVPEAGQTVAPAPSTKNRALLFGIILTAMVLLCVLAAFLALSGPKPRVAKVPAQQGIQPLANDPSQVQALQSPTPSVPIQTPTGTAVGSSAVQSHAPYIYIHIASSGDMKLAKRMSEALIQAGFVVPGIDEQPYRYSQTELHYYWDDAQTTRDVEAILTALNKNGFNASPIRMRQNFPPRDYGIWIGTAPVVPSGKSKP